MPRSTALRCTGNGSLEGGGPGVEQTCSILAGQLTAKDWGPHTRSKNALYGLCETRYTAHAISAKPCSNGLVKGPCACSAAPLPKRVPVARISQKLPP